MEINKTTTYVAALIVGVLLVTGVMTPVIADAIGGESGGGSSAAETYTNTGEVYLKNPVKLGSETWQIDITVDEEKVTFRQDNKVFYERQKGNWTMPIFCYEDFGSYRLKALTCSMIYDSDLDENVSHVSEVGYEIAEGDIIQRGDWHDVNGISYTATNQTFDITYYYTDDTEETEEWGPIDMMVANTGEYVYSFNPVVSADQKAIFYGAYLEVANGWENMNIAGGYGTVTDIITNPESIIYMGAADFYNIAEDSYYYMDTYTATLNYSTHEYGYQLGSIDIVGDLTNGQNPDPTIIPSWEYSLNGWIVPTTVTMSGEKDYKAGYLTDVLPSEEMYIYAEEQETGKMSIMTRPLNSGDTPEPFYTQDMTEDPLVIIAIGKDWYAYIDTLPSNLENPHFHDAGLVRVVNYGYVISSNGIVIEPDGTMMYRDSSQVGSNWEELPGLIAYISSDGYMKPYYGENAVKSDAIYSGVLYSHITEDKMDILTVSIYDGFKNPAYQGGGAVIDFIGGEPTERQYLVSDMSYTTSGNYVTGAKVTATVWGQDDEEILADPNRGAIIDPEKMIVDFSLTDESELIPYDLYFDSAIGDMCIMFSIVPTDKEYSGGGGSGISPALATILTTVPLLVLAGMVIGTATFFIKRG